MSQAPFRIDKEGRWFSRGEEITHHKTYLLYSRNLTRDDAGRLILRLGEEECPVEVEDAPLIVKSLKFFFTKDKKLRTIHLLLNDESCEELDPATLKIVENNVPCCEVRGRMFRARISRPAFQLLIPFIQQDQEGKRFFLVLDGKEYFL